MTDTNRMFYVATNANTPDAAWASCIDLPKYRHETAKTIAQWVRNGAVVKRVDGDTMEAMIRRHLDATARTHGLFEADQ